MQSDINNVKFPGMWLTVGKLGITLYTRFGGPRPILSVRDQNGLWWDFKEMKFVEEEHRKELAKGELADQIKYFSFYEVP